MALLAGDGQVDAVTLARRAGRGKRSAIGIHGFARGGFLVDGGKRSEDEIGRLVARAEFPDDWRWLLVAPADKSGTGLSGQEEVQALEQLPRIPLSLTERLCRLALLEMLPAIGACRLRLVRRGPVRIRSIGGRLFSAGAGGPLRRSADGRPRRLASSGEGVGIAQTSWGPTIAVCCPTRPAPTNSKTAFSPTIAGRGATRRSSARSIPARRFSSEPGFGAENYRASQPPSMGIMLPCM